MENSFLVFVNSAYGEQRNIAVHIIDSNLHFRYSSILNIDSYTVDNNEYENKTYILLYGSNGEELNFNIDTIEYDELENEYVYKLNDSTTIIISDLEEN